MSDLVEALKEALREGLRARVAGVARRKLLHLRMGAAEELDPTPVELPPPPRFRSDVERIQALIRQEVSRAAQLRGMGSFEDEDDFSLPDDEAISRYDVRLLEPVAPESLDGDSATNPSHLEDAKTDVRAPSA